MASVLEVWGFSVQDHSVCELISLAGYGRLSLPSQCPYSTVGGGDSRAFRDHGRPCLTQTVRWGLTPEFVCDICMILRCTCAFPLPHGMSTLKRKWKTSVMMQWEARTRMLLSRQGEPKGCIPRWGTCTDLWCTLRSCAAWTQSLRPLSAPGDGVELSTFKRVVCV